MSRGLGKLQREIRDLIYDYDAWFYGEYVLDNPNPDDAPWLTWKLCNAPKER